MAIIGGGNFLTDIPFFYSIIAIVSLSFIYFLYYLISEEIIGQIIGNFILSIILVAILGSIPVIGQIGLIIFILYNVKKAFDSIIGLLGGAIFSAIIYFLLFSKETYYLSSIILYIIYLVVIGIYCFIYDRDEDEREFLFKTSVIFLSLGLITVLLVSIISTLRNALQMNIVKTSGTRDINVNAHMRGDTFVSAHTRTIQTTVLTPTLDASSAAGVSAIVKSGSETIYENSKKIEEINEDTLLIEQKNEDKTEFSKEEEEEFLLILFPNPTNKSESFYRFDELDVKKVKSLIKYIDKKLDEEVEPEDVLIYFDETLLGSGDRGVILTQYSVYVCLGFDENFWLDYQDIKNLKINGVMNKTLIFTDDRGKKYKVTLTQSNAGAKKLYDAIQTMIELYED